MYFYIISTLLFGLALSAPQDMLTQANGAVAVYEDSYRSLTEAPQSYETAAPYEPTAEQEYAAKEPEYPANDYMSTYAPQYEPTEAVYAVKEPEYAVKEPEYAVKEPEYDTKEPEYAPKEAEPTVVYEVANESDDSSTPSKESEPRPFHKQTTIINGGKHLSEAITAKIVGPVVLFNSKVAAAAGALPPMLAAKGAVIGSMISTPIEVAAVAGSSVVSGVTGKLVAVPISLGAGAMAKFVTAAEEGKQIWDFNVEHGGEVFKNGLIRLGHLVLKPVAVVVGAKTALTGAGVGLFGTGVKSVGVGMEAVGAKMVSSGLVAKGLGHRLIAKNLPLFLK
jgi:hypothetical protein